MWTTKSLEEGIFDLQVCVAPMQSTTHAKLYLTKTNKEGHEEDDVKNIGEINFTEHMIESFKNDQFIDSTASTHIIGNCTCILDFISCTLLCKSNVSTANGVTMPVLGKNITCFGKN